MSLLLSKLPYFWHNLGWSFYIAILTTAATLFFCSLAGYAFAMYHFRFKEAAFLVVMATVMLPTFLNMIPSVLVMSTLGWLNEPRALIVPGACGAFGIFLMRQYIGSAIPKELVEAARIDGCGRVRHLRAHHHAADHSGAGHAGPDHLHHVVEQLHGASGDHARNGALHRAAGAGVRCKARARFPGVRSRPAPRSRFFLC